jgi:hypothetical protein
MENNKILHIPSLSVFGDWESLQKFLERRGNPLYSVGGNLYLFDAPIQSLGNLTSVGGSLSLFGCKTLTSLGNLTSVGNRMDLEGCHNLKSLGNLTSVGGWLGLSDCQSLKSLGKVNSVGGNFYLCGTPVSIVYSEKRIRRIVDVKGKIFL